MELEAQKCKSFYKHEKIVSESLEAFTAIIKYYVVCVFFSSSLSLTFKEKWYNFISLRNVSLSSINFEVIYRPVPLDKRYF